jgi:Spy/CpxP family protein refolding chaperone
MNKSIGERSDPERRLAMLQERLSLTAEQIVRIRPILAAEQAELEKLRGDNSLNRDQRRARLQELNKNTSEKVRDVLDPEQVKKYNAIRAKISESRASNRGGRPMEIPAEFTPEKRLARLSERLDLTGEQQEKLLPILQAEYAELQKLPGNDSFNREQRRAKLQQITQETNARVMPLLTPDQQKKYQESREKLIDRRAKKKKGGEKGLERTGQPQ